MNPSEKISQTAQGYQRALVLLTAVRMNLFDALDHTPRPADHIAEKCRLDTRATEIVLLALAAEGFVEHADGLFRSAPEFAPILRSDGHATQRNILCHHYNLLERWLRLDEVLRTGRPAESADHRRQGEELRNFICGMADISRRSSTEVADKIDLSPFRRMLDLGGGPATSSIVFCRRHAHLRALVFDLPPVVEIAREEIARAGLDDRITTRAGDMLTDDYHDDRQFDLVYISNIIHMLAPPDVQRVFRKAAASLTPGGTLLVKDFFLDDSRTQPAQAALFSVNMLVGTEGGKAYTAAETQTMLTAAGFGDFETVPVAIASAVMRSRLTRCSKE